MSEIKSWLDDEVLFASATNVDVRAALEEAVASKVELEFADLGFVDLRNADLRYASLSSANLRFAKLQNADLRNAGLRYADFGSADLTFADLRTADIRSSNFGSANLQSARLENNNLALANFAHVDRGYIDLRSFDFSHFNFRTSDSRFSTAPELTESLWVFRADYFAVLDRFPDEIAGLRQALTDGQVDGSNFSGPCASLFGTFANLTGVFVMENSLIRGVTVSSRRPAEVWFVPIEEGDKAILDREFRCEREGQFRADMALRWLEEWAIIHQERA